MQGNMSNNLFYDRVDSVIEEAPFNAEVILKGNTVQIGHFEVNESARGEGVGRSVMQEIINAAEEYGADKVDVNIAYTNPELPHSNDPTTQFLESLGFTTTLHKNTITGIKRLDNEN